jgi:molecular chaperone GrpE
MQEENKPAAELEQHDAAPVSPEANHAEPEVMPSMEEMVRQAELKAEEHHDAWLRAKAEGDNIRKRAIADVAQARKFAVEGFSSEMLAVKDSLEAALAIDNATLESYKSGMELTMRQLKQVFEKFHITEIHPVNEKFDPHKHQAISMLESELAPGTVVSVLQKGYMLNDRVLRPALVTVAKAAEPKTS